nr:putative 3'-5' exonuclease domain-containing protein [Tanacetum cinerariifolium]
MALRGGGYDPTSAKYGIGWWFIKSSGLRVEGLPARRTKPKQTTKKPKCNKSLSSICHDLLGISLSKELQCSDWSLRPLTHQQKTYAALDALCLIQIFNVFLHTLLNQ